MTRTLSLWEQAQAARKAAEAAELAKLAELLGADEEAAWDFIGELPYSTIPDAYDAVRVLEYLTAIGWVRRP